MSFVRLDDDKAEEALLKTVDPRIGEYVYGSTCFSCKQRYRLAGYCDPAYRRVLAQLRQEVENDLIEDVQLCAYVRGVKVIDIMVRKHNMSAAYTRGSVQKVNSSGKNIESIVIARLVEQKLLAYDTKVASVWPEYGCNGKEATTVAHVMRHEAGLPNLVLEPAAITTAAIKAGVASAQIAELTPLHPPGEKRYYHVVSRGLLVNEIVRRVDPKGRTLAEIVAEDLAAPLGLSDELFVGVPERMHDDVAVMSGSKGAGYMCCVACCCRGEVELGGDHSTVGGCQVGTWQKTCFDRSLLCCLSPCLVPFCGLASDKQIDGDYGPDLWNAEMTSANVHSSARAMAKLGASLIGEVDGVRLLSPAGLAEGLDSAVIMNMDVAPGGKLPPIGVTAGAFSQMGLYHYAQNDSDKTSFLPGERSGMHGWVGFGGSAFSIHAERQVSFGFAVSFHNMFMVQNPLSRRLVNAVLACQESVEQRGREPAAMERM